jgi:hypothetical protein
MGKPPGCKLIRFGADLEGGIIRTISIRGDFLASPEEGFDRAERRLRGTALGDLEAAFDRLLAEEGVETLGINGAGLAQVFREALAAAPAAEAAFLEAAFPETASAAETAPETVPAASVPAGPAARTDTMPAGTAADTPVRE